MYRYTSISVKGQITTDLRIIFQIEYGICFSTVYTLLVQSLSTILAHYFSMFIVQHVLSWNPRLLQYLLYHNLKR